MISLLRVVKILLNVDNQIVAYLTVNFEIIQHFVSIIATFADAEINVDIVMIAYRVFLEVCKFFKPPRASRKVAVENPDV